jgi:hypothetical protein
MLWQTVLLQKLSEHESVLVLNAYATARESSISVPAVGGGHTGVAVTSTKPKAVEAGADRAA